MEGASQMPKLSDPGRPRRIHPGWLVPLVIVLLAPLIIVFSAVTFVVAVGAYLVWLGFLALIAVATLVFNRFRRHRARPAKPVGVQRALS